METKKKSQILVLLAVLAFLFPVCTQAENKYEIIDLGTLGGDYSVANSINNVGQIVGSADNENGSQCATLFDHTGDGNNINLGLFRGDWSSASSINDVGQIVGEYGGKNHWNGFWSYAILFDSTDPNNSIEIGVFGGDLSGANSINAFGQIVGSTTGRLSLSRYLPGAVLFDPTSTDKYVFLGTLGGYNGSASSINDIGQIVGWADNSQDKRRATMFDPSGAGNNIDLGTLGGDEGEILSNNNLGQMVGWAEDSQGHARATLFDPTGAGNIDLGTLGVDSKSMALSINDFGQIVGITYYEFDSTFYSHGTFFDPTGKGENIDLNTLIDPHRGWTLEYANDINNSGKIVGQGINPQGEHHAFLLIPISVKYSGGTGDPNDPYQIATAEDLMLLGESPEDYDKHSILTGDIDLDPNLPGRKVFDRAVIAPDTNNVEDGFQGIPFTGIFDGNDNKILHLTIEGGSYLGLFGQLGDYLLYIGDSGDYWLSVGEVKNLGVVDVNVASSGSLVGGIAGDKNGAIIRSSFCTGSISGDRFVGGLVGNNGGSIISSHSIGDVSGDYKIGGLVGCNFSGNITFCHSEGMVTGTRDVGGLVGSEGTISNSYSNSMVKGDRSVGGLVGVGDTVSNCYSNGSVMGDRNIGGLVGLNMQSISNCYSTGTVTGNEHVGGLVGNNEFYTAFDIIYGTTSQSFWNIETSGQTTSAGGTGKTTTDMQKVETFLNVGWDFVDEKNNGLYEIWQMPEVGYPVLASIRQLKGEGTSMNPYLISDIFELIFVKYDPMAHYRLTSSIDLSGISWSTPLIPSFAGIFDGNGHKISNLTISSSDKIGGVFGTLELEGQIRNLGIVDVNISVVDYAAGGLICYNQGSVLNCYSAGMVRGDDFVGGLVAGNAGSITASYSTVTVSGSEYVGGLVGHNCFWSYGAIINCYSTGSVSGNSVVGGLVGSNDRGVITSSYSTGSVIGTKKVGGLVGENTSIPNQQGQNNTGIISSSFWDSEISGQATSAGGTSKTTAEMQTATTFLQAGWDFVDETANGMEDIWWINEGQDYPRLWWELIPEN